jgi:hypothetical protein
MTVSIWKISKQQRQKYSIPYYQLRQISWQHKYTLHKKKKHGEILKNCQDVNNKHKLLIACISCKEYNIGMEDSSYYKHEL